MSKPAYKKVKEVHSGSEITGVSKSKRDPNPRDLTSSGMMVSKVGKKAAKKHANEEIDRARKNTKGKSKAVKKAMDKTRMWVYGVNSKSKKSK